MNFKNDTAAGDYELFKKLGLPKYEGIPTHAKHYVGNAQIGDASVDIYVTPMPATFWEFYIRFPNGKLQEIKTGSGGLSRYWKTLEDVCTGMIEIG